MPRIARLASTCLVAPLALVAVASAAPPTAAQQGCIVAVGQAAATLARAESRRGFDCALAAPGAVDPACLAADPQGQVASDRAAARSAIVGACAVPPPFGTADRPVPTAVDAATVHVRGLVADLFGDGSALAASGTPRCRTAVARNTDRLLAATLHDALACQRAALRAGAADAAALSSCVAAGGGSAARRAGKLRGRVRRACAATDDAALAASVRSRVACRACRLLNAVGRLDADCDQLDDGVADDTCRMRVRLEGDVIPFHLVPDGRLEGATVTVLEDPGRQVVTGADGHFVFDDLDEGSDVTLVMSHPDYHPIQTGTMRLGPAGADRVTFQAVTSTIFGLLAAVLQVTPDEDHACQMVTTLTRYGKSMYDTGAHGEAGAVVQLDPPLPAEHGPIYFNSSVIPDRTQFPSSDDGGVLFIQVPPGDYTWTATKPGTAFSRVRMRCRVGYLVNASPPWGLQVQ